MPKGQYKRQTPSEDRDMADAKRVRSLSARREAKSRERRQAEQERARKLKAECDEMKRGSLTGEPLSEADRKTIRRRVLSGLHPLRGSNLASW